MRGEEGREEKRREEKREDFSDTLTLQRKGEEPADELSKSALCQLKIHTILHFCGAWQDACRSCFALLFLLYQHAPSHVNTAISACVPAAP